MESPWFISGIAVAIFLLVSIIVRGVLWVRDVERAWTVVCAWSLDGSHSGSTSIRVRLPAQGYQIARRGNRFRGERVDASGSVVARFGAHHHMTEAVADCWSEWGDLRGSTWTLGVTSSLEKGRLDSELGDVSGTLHTA